MKHSQLTMTLCLSAIFSLLVVLLLTTKGRTPALNANATLATKISKPATAATNFNFGDLFLAQGSGLIQWRNSAGTFITTINTGDGSNGNGGGIRHHPVTGKLWVTNFFGKPSLRLVNIDGSVGSPITAPEPYQTNPESVVFDMVGNAYIGGPGGKLVKLDPTGNFIAAYQLPAEGWPGPDWIELGCDQRTIYYTYEHARIKRYDTLTQSPLPDFADLSGVAQRLFALRRLKDNTILVATGEGKAYRLNQSGSIIKTYIPTNPVGTFALALTPDGNAFWGGGFAFNGPIYKFDIASGTVLASFNTGATAMNISGIAVYGDYGFTGCNPKQRNDFDGDGKSDVGVFRPSNGYWYVHHSSNNIFITVPFGTSGDRIVPGDYDGDGKTDTGVWRPSNGSWYILNSQDNTFHNTPFGTNGDIPVAGDYDGDGKTDISVYRPSTGTFYLLYSSDNSFHLQQWGTNGDLPLMGDYDGDSKSDFAIFRPSSSTFHILRSYDGATTGQQWGTGGDKPIAVDFDGDGKTDICVYRPSDATWSYLQSSDNSLRSIAWGIDGDVPVAGDYDGDYKWDAAIFRPSSSTFFILLSSNSAVVAEHFGVNGDIPVAAAYVP